MSDASCWHAVVLAAGRGPGDPMSRAFGVAHKCLLPAGGVPMLRRVVRTLRSSPVVASISVVIDDERAARAALGEQEARDVRLLPAASSAAASALAALEAAPDFPVLITTADHALLDTRMIARLHAAAGETPADLLVALARRETVLARYPRARRTWLRLGGDAMTGCNLFLLATPRARVAVEFWRALEGARKRPWRLARAFGARALLKLLLGRTSLDDAFRLASRRLGIVVRPVEMPMPEAAIDVDKPQDLALVEEILRVRGEGGGGRGADGGAPALRD